MVFRPQDMNQQTLVIPIFAKGVNSFLPPEMIADDALVSARNIYAREDGFLVRRPGITSLGTLSSGLTSAGSVVGLGVFGTASSRRLLLVVTDGSATKILSHDGTSWSTVASPTVTPDFPSEMAWHRDETSSIDAVYVPLAANPPGTSEVWQVDLSSWSAAALSGADPDPPSDARLFLSHGTVAWASGRVGSYRNTLYWTSRYPYMDAWSQSVQVLAIPTSDGQDIMALAPYRSGSILVGLDRAIVAIVPGTSLYAYDWQSSVVSNQFGIGSQGSAVLIGGDVLFADHQGEIRKISTLAQASGSGIEPMPLSIPIKDDLPDQLDSAKVGKISAAVFDGFYWVTFPRTDGTWGTYAFSLTLQSWFGPFEFKDGLGNDVHVQRLAAASGALGSNTVSDAQHRLYLAGKVSGAAAGSDIQVFYIDSAATPTLDAGATAIEGTIETKAIDFGIPQQDKLVHWVEVLAVLPSSTAGLFECDARFDYKDWVHLGTVAVSQSVSWDRVRLAARGLGRGKVFQLRFRSTSSLPTPSVGKVLIRFSAFDPGGVR